MIKKILRILLSASGLLLGYTLADIVLSNNFIVLNSNLFIVMLYVALMAVIAIFFYIISPYIIGRVEKLVDSLERLVVDQPKENVLFGLLGFIIGIIIALLLTFPLTLINAPSIFETILTIVSVIIYITLGMLGYRLAISNKGDIFRQFSKMKIRDEKKSEIVNVNKGELTKKLLDTSVLIDGRIKQIVETGFIEGELIIPNFVLNELQLIADSADDLKRERGRRGLDIVNDLKTSKFVEINLSKKDYSDVDEVDIKLLKYAGDTHATIITNDFNLNKLAQVQGIKVLNINELANSVKTIVIPGETMIVNIVKEGKEKNQGLAYLDDGTMIVVEEGKYLIGVQVEVVVTTVLQTAAGKMIFAKIINK